MSNGSIAKKLLIKPGQRIAIVNPPPGYLTELGQLPEGVEISDKLDGTFDFVQVFAKNTEELGKLGPAATRAVKRDGVLWFSYPKRTAKVQTDITRDAGWDTVRNAGFEGVAMVSIDDVWSAFRFRPSDLVGKKK